MKKNVIRVAVIVVAVAFVVIGVFRGEARAVCNRAIDICLSCIGIG